MCHVARGAPGVWRDWTLKSELAKGKLNWASHHQLLQAASLDRGEEPSWGEGDEDGNDQRLLLPPALRAAAPPPARPAAQQQQLRTAVGGPRPRPSLQVAAAAATGGGQSVKAATDAEFFQTSDTRPIMLFDGAYSLLPLLASITTRLHLKAQTILQLVNLQPFDLQARWVHGCSMYWSLRVCVMQVCATSATAASGSSRSMTPTGWALFVTCEIVQMIRSNFATEWNANAHCWLISDETEASGISRCRANPGGSSFRGQGEPLMTSRVWFLSRRTGKQLPHSPTLISDLNQRLSIKISNSLSATSKLVIILI